MDYLDKNETSPIVCNKQNGIWALKILIVKIGILALDLWDFYDDGLLTNHSIIQRRKIFFKGKELFLRRRYKSKDTHVLWLLFFRDILEAIFGRSTIYILSIIQTNMVGRWSEICLCSVF